MNRYSTYIPKPSRCSYLPEQTAQLEYRLVTELSVEKYSYLVRNGWRRFGDALFRPRCPACTACQPIRVIVERFAMNRSQRRVHKINQDIELRIGAPICDEERLGLYFKHHAHHAEQKGWPQPQKSQSAASIYNIIDGPLPVQEWAYYLGEKLIAIAYIDQLLDGFSGIYFYHDPDERERSLGNWICLSTISRAAELGLPYVYLGFYIANCRSMEYKGRFQPNQVLGADGQWHDFMGFPL